MLKRTERLGCWFFVVCLNVCIRQWLIEASHNGSILKDGLCASASGRIYLLRHKQPAGIIMLENNEASVHRRGITGSVSSS